MTAEDTFEEYKNNPKWQGKIFMQDEKTCYKDGFLDGLKAGRPEWHKVADGDLPKHEVNVLVLYNVQCIDIAHYNYDYEEWHFSDSIVRDVIAWCEIPKYTEE